MEVLIKFDTKFLSLFESLGIRQRGLLAWLYLADSLGVKHSEAIPCRLRGAWLQLQSYALSAAPVVTTASAVRDGSVSRSVMSIPTLEEVCAYAKRKGYTVDVEKFYAYYQSNGWRVGKNRMKSWHYALAYWVKNEQRNVVGGTVADRLRAAEEYFSEYLQRSSQE